MNNFFSKIAGFMYGRYGNDNLNIALGIFWLIINIINTVFIRSFWLQMITNLILLIIIFRIFSKNIDRRSRENQTFLYYYNRMKPMAEKIRSFAKKVGVWFNLQFRKIKDRKTHRYIKCPYCKATIRVPFRKGKHSVNCPRCAVDFKTNIRY